MGVLDRIRSLLESDGTRQGDGDGRGQSASGGNGAGGSRTAGGQLGIDRGAGSDRVGVDPDDDRKTGAHGSHWDAVVPTDDAVRDATLDAVQEGDPVAGRSIRGSEVVGHRYPREGAVRTCAVSVDGTVTTAYPTAEGVPHEVTVTEVVEWANDVEAQVAFDLAGQRAAAFDASYFRHGGTYGEGDALRVALSGLAYDLSPAENGSDGGSGTDVPGDDPVAFVGFDGGDADDYLFRSRIRAVDRTAYRGLTVHRLRVPLSVDGPEIGVYAADHVLDGYVPESGEEVEGVLWLQGWTDEGG